MKSFPTEHAVAETMDLHADGMDLRDYFAAKFIPLVCKYSDFHGWNYESNANMCYAMADAMMEARK
jgi:hypothetical protein